MIKTKKAFGLLLIALGAIQSTGICQEGIHFTEGLVWREVLKKAKNENKFVFVDAFATWCGPCKTMDKEVYSNPEVGVAYNADFISVKVQMDRTSNDNRQIMEWYKDADSLKVQHKVSAYPTYLFFSPEGELVYKEIGARSTKEFIALAGAAKRKEWIVQLQNWRRGIKDSTMHALYKTASIMGNRALMDSVARDYKQYLDTLDERKLLTKQNIDFLFSNAALMTSRDRVFKIAIETPQKINNATGIRNGDDIAKTLASVVVIKEEIKDKLLNNGNREPEWEQYQAAITTQYPMLNSQKLVIEQKMIYYPKVKDWNNYVEAVDEYITLYKNQFSVRDAFWKLNSYAWELFEHTADHNLLQRALQWAEMAVFINPNDLQIMDTKANLLYKLGRIEEAIVIEEQALRLFLAAAEKAKEKGRVLEDPYFAATLSKMKKRTPTWPLSKDADKGKK